MPSVNRKSVGCAIARLLICVAHFCILDQRKEGGDCYHVSLYAEMIGSGQNTLADIKYSKCSFCGRLFRGSVLRKQKEHGSRRAKDNFSASPGHETTKQAVYRRCRCRREGVERVENVCVFAPCLICVLVGFEPVGESRQYCRQQYVV